MLFLAALVAAYIAGVYTHKWATSRINEVKANIDAVTGAKQ